MNTPPLRPTTLNVWLRLARLSNAPTLLTNVMAGTALALTAHQLMRPLPVLALSGALLFFYAAGMLLNDYCDREFDAANRPERPIPRGETTARRVLQAAVILSIAGLGALAAFGWRPLAGGGLLLALIIVYDRWHKNNPWAPLLMGLCRWMVYSIPMLAIVATPHREGWLTAAVPGAYVVGLTLLARHETRNHPPPRLAGLVILAASAAFWAILPGLNLQWFPIALGLLSTAWTLHSLCLAFRAPHRIGPAIGALLAGICLLDAWLLAAHGHATAATIALLAFVTTRRWQAHIAPS